MLSEELRTEIALKRFSLISPVINKQVNNNNEYFLDISEKEIEIPHLGVRKYSPKTLQSWYSSYMKNGIDSLKPSPRGDRGNSRKINFETKVKINEVLKKYPRAPITVIYDQLITNEIIDPSKVSISTIYRVVKNTKELKENIVEEIEDKKRFSHEFVNQLWQTDVMYGPYIKQNRKKKRTYLLAYIDDCSRLITHAQFYHEQNFESMRLSFKEAILKRGIPKMLYTDNGKIYKTIQLEYICASLGCSLIHAKPFTPTSKGKIERFFLTVRKRFLSLIDIESIKSIDELNEKFFKWLQDDYQKKIHGALAGMTPLDKFMTQVWNINLENDPNKVKEKFYLREKRTITHDATFSINKVMYETNANLAKAKVQIRYEPEWIGKIEFKIPIYIEDKFVSHGTITNFTDNAYVKRRCKAKIKNDDEIIPEENNTNNIVLNLDNQISFQDIYEED